VCTLALFRDCSRRFPLVVAANRDELLARPTAPPARLDDISGVVAGRDLEARGTWLGARVDGDPLIAGLLNRRPADPTARSTRGELSRGHLCLEALRAHSADDAVARIEREARDIDRYGPFNLLLADRVRAVVLDNARGLRATELAAGMSLLTNLDVNDPRCPRLASAVAPFERVARLLAEDVAAEDVLSGCADVLASHENSLDPADASPLSRLCVHTEMYGTRSSSLILVGANGGVRYFHAPGPPCVTPYGEVAGQ
jgi:uncharacterized protein with NRDE domain